MDGRIDVTTLLFLVLAVVIFLKLRSVLGRRTGHEQARLERYKAQQEASQRAKVPAQDKVVTQTPEAFSHHYPGDTAMFYGTFPR